MNRFLKRSSSDGSSDSDAYVPSDEEEKQGQASDWTRVKGRGQFTAKYPTVFDLGADLTALRSEKIKVVEPNKMEQLLLFDPETFKGREKELVAEANALTQEQLLDYGKMVT